MSLASEKWPVAARVGGTLGVGLPFALVALVILAPLPLGSNRPWSWSLLVLLFGVLLLADALARAAGSGHRSGIPNRLIAGPAALYALATGWTIWQATTLFPAGWEHPDWIAAAQGLKEQVESYGAVDPDAAWTGVMKAMTYGGIFWMACQLYRDVRKARLALDAIFFATTAYAVFALLLEGPALGERISGTFANANHFGTFLGLGVLAGLVRAAGRLAIVLADSTDWRSRVRDALLFLFGRGSLYVAGILALSVAIIQTESRGAAAATVASACVVVGVLMVRYRRAVGRLGIGLMLAGAMTVGTLALLTDNTLTARLATVGDDLPVLRIPGFEMALAMIDDRPWLGHGLGSYVPLSEHYRNFPDKLTMNSAHNEYLETAVELGIPGAAVLVAAIGWIVIRCAIGAFRRRRNYELPLLGTGAGILLAFHSLVDFSLRIPAIAATSALVLGIAYAHAWPENRLGGNGTNGYAATPRRRTGGGAATERLHDRDAGRPVVWRG